MTTGAWSERRIVPLAEQIEQAARVSESWPAYLDSAAYGSAVSAWARSEAVVSLLWSWLDEHAQQGLDEVLADTSTEETEETASKGRTRRMTTGRRVVSVLEQLRKWETTAANHRARLGLDPLSRARFGKDVAITGAVAGQIERLTATGAALVEQYGRPALSAAEKPVAEPSTQPQGDTPAGASTSDTGGSDAGQH
jgi:hypothetical protein